MAKIMPLGGAPAEHFYGGDKAPATVLIDVGQGIAIALEAL